MSEFVAFAIQFVVVVGSAGLLVVVGILAIRWFDDRIRAARKDRRR